MNYFITQSKILLGSDWLKWTEFITLFRAKLLDAHWSIDKGKMAGV